MLHIIIILASSFMSFKNNFPRLNSHTEWHGAHRFVVVKMKWWTGVCHLNAKCKGVVEHRAQWQMGSILGEKSKHVNENLIFNQDKSTKYCISSEWLCVCVCDSSFEAFRKYFTDAWMKEHVIKWFVDNLISVYRINLSFGWIDSKQSIRSHTLFV